MFTCSLPIPSEPNEIYYCSECHQPWLARNVDGITHYVPVTWFHAYLKTRYKRVCAYEYHHNHEQERCHDE